MLARELGPRSIEAFTYRMGAHTTSDDPTRYRLDSDVEAWRLRDPLERVRSFLHKQQLVDDDFFAELEPSPSSWPSGSATASGRCLIPASTRCSSTRTPSRTHSSSGSAMQYAEYLAGFAAEDGAR